MEDVTIEDEMDSNDRLVADVASRISPGGNGWSASSFTREHWHLFSCFHAILHLCSFSSWRNHRLCAASAARLDLSATITSRKSSGIAE